MEEEEEMSRILKKIKQTAKEEISNRILFNSIQCLTHKFDTQGDILKLFSSN